MRRSAALPWVREIPQSLDASYIIKGEPHQSSCDGMAGTQGWTQVVVEGSFHWVGSNEALFGSVDSRLGALGWHRTPIPVTNEAMWKKHLENGTIATATLDSSALGYPNWDFTALAPPAGKAASGC